MKKLGCYVWILMVIGGAILEIIGLMYLPNPAKEGKGLAFTLIGLVMLSSFLVYFGIQGSKLKKERNNTASYDKEKKILRVYQCNPILKTSIAIEPIKHFSIHNTPTKTHFGAVTVGGVTTGGTYTTGGQRVINTTDKSGYYRLVWTGDIADKNETFEIKTFEIKLSCFFHRLSPLFRLPPFHYSITAIKPELGNPMNILAVKQ